MRRYGTMFAFQIRILRCYMNFVPKSITLVSVRKNNNCGWSLRAGTQNIQCIKYNKCDDRHVLPRRKYVWWFGTRCRYEVEKKKLRFQQTLDDSPRSAVSKRSCLRTTTGWPTADPPVHALRRHCTHVYRGQTAHRSSVRVRTRGQKKIISNERPSQPMFASLWLLVTCADATNSVIRRAEKSPRGASAHSVRANKTRGAWETFRAKTISLEDSARRNHLRTVQGGTKLRVQFSFSNTYSTIGYRDVCKKYYGLSCTCGPQRWRFFSICFFFFFKKG